jgi:flagellar M-ring protein FliF
MGSISLIEDEYLKTKIAYEGQKRDSILGALRDIPGVRVEVNADFDSTVEETTDNVKPGEKPTAQRESTTTEDMTESSADSGNQVGQTAQGPNRQVTNQTTPQRQNRTHNEATQTENVVGVDRNRTVKKGYVPREVWATVSLPGAYIKNVWSAQNPASAPPKPEDLTKVQTNVVHNVEEIVDPLLYLQGTKAGNTYKHVRVVVMDSLPVPTIEMPSMTTKAVAWTGRYWSTVAMVGVAMFSLVVLRSVVNGKPAGPTSAAAMPNSLTLHSDEPTKDEAATDQSPDPERPRLRLKKGKSLKDDLVEIVRDDPNAAADILRSWIGKAS